jgi:hypothetical protein
VREEGQIDVLVPRTPCVNAAAQWRQLAGSAPADPPEPLFEAPAPPLEAPPLEAPPLEAPPVEVSPPLPPELAPAPPPPASSWTTRTLAVDEHAATEAITDKTQPKREPKLTPTG